jgi:hypothetical protein
VELGQFRNPEQEKGKTDTRIFTEESKENRKRGSSFKPINTPQRLRPVFSQLIALLYTGTPHYRKSKVHHRTG